MNNTPLAYYLAVKTRRDDCILAVNSLDNQSANDLIIDNL